MTNNKQKINNKINLLEEKKKEIEDKITSLKSELNNEIDNIEWISINKDFEVTKKVLHKGKSFNEIIQLKKSNEDLLSLKQIAIILENPELVKELRMDSKYSTNDDFYFKQPFETNEEKKYVAGFYSYSGGSGLVFGRDADYSDRYRGVRFVRKKVKKVKR